MKYPFPIGLLMLATAGGCSPATYDERFVELASQASDRQAEQNREIAEQNQQLAEATKKLLEADAAARQHLIEAEATSRREYLELQQGLQAERSVIGHERDALEGERRRIAEARQWDSLVAQVLSQAGLLLGCLAPLAVCCYLLYGLKHSAPDEALGELLVQDLVSESPLLMPAAARSAADRLSAPSESPPPGAFNGGRLSNYPPADNPLGDEPLGDEPLGDEPLGGEEPPF